VGVGFRVRVSNWIGGSGAGAFRDLSRVSLGGLAERVADWLRGAGLCVVWVVWRGRGKGMERESGRSGERGLDERREEGFSLPLVLISSLQSGGKACVSRLVDVGAFVWEFLG